ncbi:hypothetical protein CPB97_009162 [Podila verticillata]|nr:hypothetical protein CPB97_009162 [Podila verticillata]
MVTAIAESSSPPPKVRAPMTKTGFRQQSSLIRSLPIPIIDFDILAGAPTSPLPIPKLPPSPSVPTPPLPSSPTTRTPPRKVSNDKISSLGLTPGSLRPPPRPSTQSPGPRPRSMVSHLALSTPPSSSLPPVPAILHSNDNMYGSSTPTSPTSPTSPTPIHTGQYSTFSTKQLQLELSLSTSLPFTLRPHTGSGRRATNSSDTMALAITGETTHNKEKYSARLPSLPSVFSGAESQSVNDNNTDMDMRHKDRMGIMEEPRRFILGQPDEISKDKAIMVQIDPLPRPIGLVATRYYGIESSMRWREGVDPVEKRFTSSNGAWRCQDRFAVFFRPGDQIGPDQVVTKTFWSEAWPYPIETILYGTIGPLETTSQPEANGHRSDHESEHRLSRTRAQGNLKMAASFPPSLKSKDPRYITSAGVRKIAKVTIPMPDVAIDQMDLVKAPIKVELRIFILESPLRIHATAFLLGRTVAGTTELYM